ARHTRCSPWPRAGRAPPGVPRNVPAAPGLREGRSHRRFGGSMRYRRSILAPIAVLGVAVITGGWFLQRGVDQEQNVYFQARLFQEVLDRIASDFVEPVPKDSLYHSAIDGLIKELKDPNSSFMEAAEYENLRIRTQGDYGGVGLEITEREGFVTVVTTIPGTPGTRAGLRPGDQFVEIDGKNAEGMDSDKAVDLLRGPAGTDV